jgi:hypothetical protein
MELERKEEKQTSWGLIAVIVVAVIVSGCWYLYSQSLSNDEPMQPTETVYIEQVEEDLFVNPSTEKVTLTSDPNEILETKVFIEKTEDTAPIMPALPSLNQSDGIVRDRLSVITWRKELLKLLVTDDAIRRFVVFTDNFYRGDVVYEHSPFILPKEKFSAQKTINTNATVNTYKWDQKSVRRFNIYIDLFKTLDKQMLADVYFEFKPLIDQAYSELGYPEQDFTQVLLSAISRVLDFDVLDTPATFIRNSVMYKYEKPELEALDDADKLLLRIGKDNLLIIKSILLEINDKISRVTNAD